MNLLFADPTEWWLEIWPKLQADDWQASQALATPTRRKNFFLNQLCLHVLLPWLQAEYAADTAPWPNISALHSIWEMVNGLSLTMAAKRLVLIPSETLDSTELEVPQEWVDTPNWTADYYLAIQINLEASWIRVWAYTTHQQLKQNATFDPSDRSYSLAPPHLIRDLNAFWNTLQFCPQAATQTPLPNLPSLSPTQVAQLIQQLSRPSILFPRLALPFHLWAALLSQPDWRRQLYHNRLSNLSPQTHTLRSTLNLNQWRQRLSLAGWQSLDSLLGTLPHSFTPGFRAFAVPGGVNEQRVKLIHLSTDSTPHTVVLLLAFNPEPDGRVSIRVQVHPTRTQPHLPPNLTLAIYSHSDVLLHSIHSRSHDIYIQLPLFRCSPGAQFHLRLSLANHRFSELFTV